MSNDQIVDLLEDRVKEIVNLIFEYHGRSRCRRMLNGLFVLNMDLLKIFDRNNFLLQRYKKYYLQLKGGENAGGTTNEVHGGDASETNRLLQ